VSLYCTGRNCFPEIKSHIFIKPKFTMSLLYIDFFVVAEKSVILDELIDNCGLLRK